MGNIQDKVTVGKWGKVIGPPTDEWDTVKGKDNLLMNFNGVEVNMSRGDLMSQNEYREQRFKNSGAEKEQKLRAKINIQGKVTEGKWGKVIGPPTDAGYDGNNNDDARNNLLMNFDKVQVNMARSDLMTQEEYRQERFTNSKAEKEQKL